MPTQVVVPPVSCAVALQGAALTTFAEVETPKLSSNLKIPADSLMASDFRNVLQSDVSDVEIVAPLERGC
jgi:hypothetical protein